MSHPMPNIIWRVLNHNNRLSGTCGRVSVPMRMQSDFDAHYILFDNSGEAKQTAKSFREAFAIRRSTGLNLTRILG